MEKQDAAPSPGGGTRQDRMRRQCQGDESMHCTSQPKPSQDLRGERRLNQNVGTMERVTYRCKLRGTHRLCGNPPPVDLVRLRAQDLSDVHQPDQPVEVDRKSTRLN